METSISEESARALAILNDALMGEVVPDDVINHVASEKHGFLRWLQEHPLPDGGMEYEQVLFLKKPEGWKRVPISPPASFVEMIEKGEH